MRQKSRLVSLFAALCGVFSSANVKADGPPRRIVFLGDSLTAGYSLPLDQSYPSLIQERLDGEKLPFKVVNSGISGDTTAGGLRRLDWILRQPVDILVIALGANDGLRGLPLDSIESNLLQMIEKTRSTSPATTILLAGIRMPLNMGEDYTSAFEAIFPKVAASQHVPLLPFLLDGVAGVPELNLPDGIHPTAEGYRLIAENMWKFLKPFLISAPASADP